jgi:hypothetical protein
LQRANLQQRRRERVKKIVVVSVAAIAAILVVLLIQGCVGEHAKASTTTSATVGSGPKALPDKVVVTELEPVTTG